MPQGSHEIAHSLRQSLLAVPMLTADPGHALIRPGCLGEQPADVRVAGRCDRPATHAWSARVFRRNEAQIRHQLARMAEPVKVAEFCDEGRGSSVLTTSSSCLRRTTSEGPRLYLRRMCAVGDWRHVVRQPFCPAGEAEAPEKV
jgi:hypothetical protein